MKSKAPLALTELIIMLLVFALCSALCLKGLVAAEMTKRADTERDNAIICIQNTAEMVKYSKGDLPAEIYFDSSFDPCSKDDASYAVRIERYDSGNELLGLAGIAIYRTGNDDASDAADPENGGKAIAELKAAWQEDRP